MPKGVKKLLKKQNNKGRKRNQFSDLDRRPGTINWNVNAMKVPGMINTIARDNRPYTVMQNSNQGRVLQSQTALFQVGSKAWTTADITQFSSFSSIFDQYKIDFIEVWLTPYGPGVVAGYNSNTKIYSVVDYDDANAPTSIAALTQYENCVITRANEGHYVKFRPHIAVAGFGGAFTQFKNEKSDWIDVASTSMQHYGFKFGCDPTTATNDVQLDMETRITVSFRNVF